MKQQERERERERERGEEMREWGKGRVEGRGGEEMGE